MLKSRIRAELLTGLIAGTVLLGAGGRVVMRVIALTSNRPPASTSGGILTVVVWGAGIGLLGAIVHLALEGILPTREMLRESIFGGLLVLMAIAGLNREMPPAALLFVPMIGLYGLVMVLVSRKASKERSVTGNPRSTLT